MQMRQWFSEKGFTLNLILKKEFYVLANHFSSFNVQHAQFRNFDN